MKKTVYIFTLVVILFTAIVTTVSASGDIVVIVNKDNNNPIDKKLIIQIYTGSTKGWPDGTPFFSLDQVDSNPIKKNFYKNIIGKIITTIRAIWAQNIFSGRGLPPKFANQDENMKQLVSTNKNAIGYIHAANIDDSVKVITP